MSGAKTARVFISYSHDSASHEQRVLDLANRLRREGVDAWIDRYEPHPPEGWPRWMQKQIESATFVLAVCTETYCRRFEGNEKAGGGLGASWEGMLATQMLYQSGGRNDRLVPVQFDGGSRVVPGVLQPFTRYRLPDEYEQLYRHLTKQDEVAPPLGKRIKLGTGRRSTASNRRALPTMIVSGTGAPEPTKLQSPFVVGPPIEKPEDFFGRTSELDEIRHGLSANGPIQLVGETRMGKTSLLNRVPEHLPQNYPLARINAQGLAGRSPRELLAAIARNLNRSHIIEAMLADNRADSLLAALNGLVPCAVLVDEADALAEGGHGFDRGFFDHCRTLCQERDLIWVSASRSDLEPLFAKSGLCSRFLNDSKRVRIGLLDDRAADDLVSLLGPPLAVRAREQAGRFAMGLQWMGHELWQNGDRPLLCEDFANAMESCFAAWWERLDGEERRLLKRSSAGVASSGLGERKRKKLAALRQRGLVEDKNGTFRVPGAAWRSFVNNAQ
jgi:hypothetical protein